ncbi:MAG: hypothetical protein VKN13_08995 [Cyanobacteriota bacterium]|nr:hypothetical protein [Cyanobacteriota bacterium]
MPLPHPPGYHPTRQRRVDRRRILLSALLAALASALLLALHRRAAAVPGQTLAPVHPLAAALLVVAAATGSAYGETMRQLALTRLGEDQGPHQLR